MRPAYITATRSAVSAITPMSWVISITAVPCSRHRRFSSWMICAWIETSSAVVGSSAMMSCGFGAERQRDHHALAHAAGELVRDSGRCAAPAAGMPTSLQQLDGARARLAGVHRQVRLDRLDELAADGVERIERGQRVLEDRADLAPADLAHRLAAAGCRCGRPRAGSAPPAMRPGGSSRPMIAAPVSDLPAPDSPTTPSTSPGRDVEAHVVDRDQRAAARGELDAQVADCEQGAVLAGDDRAV